MKRSELLRAAPVGLLAACSGGASLLTGGGLFKPASSSSGCPGKQWQFSWTDGMSKSGGISTSTAAHKQGSQCQFVDVGGVKLDFLINKGGAYVRQNCTFHALGMSQTWALYQLPGIFSQGSIVNLFKKWYFKNRPDWPGGSLFDSNSNLLATAFSDQKFTTTTITFFGVVGSILRASGSSQQWTYNWGDTWQNLGGSGYGGSHDVSGDCIFAMAGYFGCCVAWIVSCLAAELGPLEWLAIAGTTAALFASANTVLDDCNK